MCKQRHIVSSLKQLGGLIYVELEYTFDKIYKLRIKCNELYGFRVHAELTVGKFSISVVFLSFFLKRKHFSSFFAKFLTSLRQDPVKYFIIERC